MRQFLRETLDLAWWAFFCPQRLQQRMNELSSQGTRNIGYDEILLPDVGFHARFFAQFALLVLLAALPLLLLVTARGAGFAGLLLLVAALFCSYGAGLLHLPTGLSVPLVTALVYWRDAVLVEKMLGALEKSIPNQQALLPALLVTIVGLSTTCLLTYDFWRRNLVLAGRLALVVGSAVSLGAGLDQIALSLREVSLAMLLTGLVTFGRSSDEPYSNTQRSIGDAIAVVVLAVGAFIVAFVVVVRVVVVVDSGVPVVVRIGTGNPLEVGFAGIVASFVAGIVAFLVGVVFGSSVGGEVGIALLIDKVGVVGVVVGVVGVVVGVVVAFVVAFVVGVVVSAAGLLPLGTLLALGWLLGLAAAPTHRRWVGVLVAGVLGLLALGQHGWSMVLPALGVVAGFYRWPLPGLAYLLVVLPTAIDRLNTPAHARRLLNWLPPFTGEILFLPLPSHERLLASAFRVDAQFVLSTLQAMRTALWPGLRLTARRAVPLLASEALAAVSSTEMLVAVARPDHPALPLLLADLYAAQDEDAQTLSTRDLESAALIPHFRRLARDVAAALEAESPFLRERGLERVQTELGRLQAQLPGLGLPASSLPRWQAAIAHWDRVVQAECTWQAAGAGEVIQPFQSGNPLSLDRAYLFKGRRRFADDLLRRVLDRSRPTLVLYGPRRCGKSSFLRQLSRLLPADLMPAYVDLQSEATRASEGDFCFALVRALVRDVRAQGVEVPDRPSRDTFRAIPYTTLEDWLDELEGRLGGRRVLLCLDEMEKLGQDLHAGRLPERLLDELRHLIQHREELSFLFCGVQTLEALAPRWASYFVSTQPIEMLYLNPEEAREVLEDPDPKFTLRYSPGVVERVLAETRGQPYLVQLIGEAMVRQANLNHVREITPPLLEAALADALTSGTIYFTDLWNEYTGSTSEEVAAGRELLRTLARGEPLPSLDGVGRAAWQHMRRFHVVKEVDGTGRIEIPFIARWVRERAVG